MNVLNKGMSLLEILVAITIFAVLGVIVSQSVISTLRGAKKSESQVKVRENLNYALSVIERQLRNADSISSCTAQSVTYVDLRGDPTTFSCAGSPNYYVASGSARLTSNEVSVTSCTFTCDLSSDPPSVEISLTGKDSVTPGVEGATVTTGTRVFLRTY